MFKNTGKIGDNLMGSILKTVVILSAIAGLAAGGLLSIPFFTPLIFLLLLITIGAGIIAYIKKSILAKNIAFITGFLFLSLLLRPVIFILLFLIMGAGIIVYLKKNALVGILSIQDGALIGTVSGFISLVAASVIYVPIWCLINIVFGNHSYKFGLGSSFTMISYNLFFAVMLVFFVALLSAIFNAFTGMVATYIYEKIENKPFEFHTHFEVEQDD